MHALFLEEEIVSVTVNAGAATNGVPSNVQSMVKIAIISATAVEVRSGPPGALAGSVVPRKPFNGPRGDPWAQCPVTIVPRSEQTGQIPQSSTIIVGVAGEVNDGHDLDSGGS